MDELKIRQVSLPIHTGIPPAEQSSPAQTEGTDFREILRRKMETGPTFSKHAASRAAERGIDLSRDSMEKLNEGMKLAEEKGLKEPLILVGGNAFIVSVTNNTVITTISGSELKRNVITNIDGTVIL